MQNRCVSLMSGHVLVVSAMFFATAASAQVTTGNLNVQITIEEQCTLGTISNVNFGSHGILATNVDAAGAIEVTCTAGTDYSLNLNEGLGSGATEAARLMTAGGATITYSLYQDTGRALLWGSSTDALAGVGTGSAETLNVYGRVPPQSTPAAGIYNDTVTVTLTY